MTNAEEARNLVQTKQYDLNEIQSLQPTFNHQNPVKVVLRLLRQQRDDSPVWLPLVEVVNHCTSLGLQSTQIQGAISALVDEGFLEEREGSIRAIPLS